ACPTTPPPTTRAATARTPRSRPPGSANRSRACAPGSPPRARGARPRKPRGRSNASARSTPRSTPTWPPPRSRWRRCSTTCTPIRRRTCSRSAPPPSPWSSAMDDIRSHRADSSLAGVHAAAGAGDSAPAPAPRGGDQPMSQTPTATPITLIEAITRALAWELEHDPSVLVLGEDVGVNGGVFRATAGRPQQFGPQRVLATPLDETTIAGLSVGLAAQGMKPVAEAQFDGFVYPMLDHLICHAARLRNRTRGRLHCPMVLRVPWGGGIRAPEHHSEANEAMFTNVPGLRVV